MSALDEFKKHNPLVEVVRETEHINMNKMWADDTFMCRFPIDADFSPIEFVELPIELAAIFHKKEQKLEFIYAPLATNRPFLPRKTSFYYQGIEFKSEFSEPSEALKFLASSFKELDAPSETVYRHLRIFRDFYIEDQQNI